MKSNEISNATAPLRGHAARRQSAYVDVERNVPPVVAGSRRSHTYLPDDLKPQVQRRLRVRPLSESYLWELGSDARCRAHGFA